MESRTVNRILKRIEEEFIRTTDTLWENEVSANIFVARIMLITAGLDAVFMVLNVLGFFSIDKHVLFSVLAQAFVELVIPALICFYFKGKKKWLKIVLLIEYTIVLSRIESVMTHNVTISMVFPVIVSVRYYSRPITAFVAFLTVLLSGFADYFAVYHQMGRIDLNMVELPAGTILSFDTFASLRDIVEAQAVIDYNKLWSHTLQHDYLPKILQFILIAYVCTRIAGKGRQAIFDQQAETKKTERISTELNLASNIQANMLPNIFPAFPDRDDFDIYATMTPAKEVGGDFYDFFMIGKDHLCMVIADVSGKGIPAAMFMVIAKTLIKDHVQLGLQPDEVFTRVNSILCEGNEADLFVTAWMGILDLNSGVLSYANAGHNPPVIRMNGEISYLHSKPGFVLAGMDGYRYQKSELKLNKGDGIFLYTDGVTEATNAGGELYGEARLLECLKNKSGKTCADTLHAVRFDIDSFVGEAEQFDDLTILAFAYANKEKDRMVVERTFDATDENLHTVLAYVEEQLEKNGASMKNIMAITVAVEEIFVNICHYAYEGRIGKATVGMKFADDEVLIYFLDNGIPFNPLDREDPDIKASVEERDIGGLGIYMVKQSMDDCVYERRNNENRFMMRKALR